MIFVDACVILGGVSEPRGEGEVADSTEPGQRKVMKTKPKSRPPPGTGSVAQYLAAQAAQTEEAQAGMPSFWGSPDRPVRTKGSGTALAAVSSPLRLTLNKKQRTGQEFNLDQPVELPTDGGWMRCRMIQGIRHGHGRARGVGHGLALARRCRKRCACPPRSEAGRPSSLGPR